MTKNRHAFTLVELLVAMAVASILLGTVTVSFAFINKQSNFSIKTISANSDIRSIKDYILHYQIIDDSLLEYSDNTFRYNGNDVYYDLIFDDVTFTINSDSKSYNCDIEYSYSDKSYDIEFVIKMVEE